MCGFVSVSDMAHICHCLMIAVFIFTGNVKLWGDSVKQQQAGHPKRSAATFQPRNNGIDHIQWPAVRLCTTELNTLPCWVKTVTDCNQSDLKLVCNVLLMFAVRHFGLTMSNTQWLHFFMEIVTHLFLLYTQASHSERNLTSSYQNQQNETGRMKFRYFYCQPHAARSLPNKLKRAFIFMIQKKTFPDTPQKNWGITLKEQ